MVNPIVSDTPQKGGPAVGAILIGIVTFVLTHALVSYVLVNMATWGSAWGMDGPTQYDALLPAARGEFWWRQMLPAPLRQACHSNESTCEAADAYIQGMRSTFNPSYLGDKRAGTPIGPETDTWLSLVISAVASGVIALMIWNKSSKNKSQTSALVDQA